MRGKTKRIRYLVNLIESCGAEIKSGSLHCASPRVRRKRTRRKMRGLASVGMTSIFVLRFDGSMGDVERRNWIRRIGI